VNEEHTESQFPKSLIPLFPNFHIPQFLRAWGPVAYASKACVSMRTMSADSLLTIVDVLGDGYVYVYV
jgi:hypothetical protein